MHRSLTATVGPPRYATATDSTITAFDTAAVGIAAAESGDQGSIRPGGAVGASFMELHLRMVLSPSLPPTTTM